ncbi:hypothetical protein [Thermococcus sp.]|uniref:hypothetical protein n=1 Tax=Thermococcus sp. TaxID=35749 RepID=UPI00261B1E14|nr:hypothetical protein [Thermococcus sp.]
MRKGIGVILVVLLFIPSVAGVSLSCDDHVSAPNLTLRCTLLGESNESVKVYLKSFDGVQVDSDVWVTGYPTDRNETITGNARRHYFRVPFNFSVGLKNAMEVVADKAWLGQEHYWVFYNKKNTLTFAIIHRNGKVEEKSVNVYISGRLHYPWEDKDVLHFIREIGLALGIVLAILFLSKLVELLRTERAENMDETQREKDKLKPPEPSRSSFISSAFLFLYLGMLVAPWIFYLLATPEKILGDFRLYLPTTVLAGLTLEWLIFVREAEKSGYPYVIREAPITGLEWTPLAMVPFGGWPTVFGLLLFLALFLPNQEPELNRTMRKLALPVSLVVALTLVLIANADIVFAIAFLALAFFHPHYVVLKVESAPTIEQLPVAQRSPEVRELLERFERVIRDMEREGSV